MRLIQSRAELLTQSEGLRGIYQMIELAGRTCYKSEASITYDSASEFVGRMVKSRHTAMLEHGTVYLTIKWYHIFKFFKYLLNPYTKIRRFIYVTTNFRVITEKGWLDDLKYLCKPTKYHRKRISMRFVTDRGVSHEIVRHRRFSFAQESTRYCNYSQDRFGNEITFIIPSWLTDKIANDSHFEYHKDIDMWQRSEDANTSNFLQSIAFSETNYLCLLSNGVSPQQARQVLPNALKTEIVVTGFMSDWKHFFDLRYFGTTGKPHPDMLELSIKARAVLEKAGLWGLIL